MSNEKQELKRIASLPNDELSATFRRVADAAGLDARRAEAAAKNPDKIRRKIERVTENDIQKALQSVSEEQLAEIMKALKGGQ